MPAPNIEKLNEIKVEINSQLNWTTTVSRFKTLKPQFYAHRHQSEITYA